MKVCVSFFFSTFSYYLIYLSFLGSLLYLSSWLGLLYSFWSCYSHNESISNFYSLSVLLSSCNTSDTSECTTLSTPTVLLHPGQTTITKGFISQHSVFFSFISAIVRSLTISPPASGTSKGSKSFNGTCLFKASTVFTSLTFH